MLLNDSSVSLSWILLKQSILFPESPPVAFSSFTYSTGQSPDIRTISPNMASLLFPLPLSHSNYNEDGTCKGCGGQAQLCLMKGIFDNNVTTVEPAYYPCPICVGLGGPDGKKGEPEKTEDGHPWMDRVTVQMWNDTARSQNGRKVKLAVGARSPEYIREESRSKIEPPLFTYFLSP